MSFTGKLGGLSSAMFKSCWIAAIALGLALSSETPAQQVIPSPADSPSTERGTPENAQAAEREQQNPALPIRIVQSAEEAQRADEGQLAAAEREQRDLAAQESMAESTEQVVVVSWASLLIAAIGSFLVLVSLLISTATFVWTTRSHRRELRAYLGTREVIVKIDSQGRWVQCTVYVHNSGQTPAREVRGYHGWALEPHPFREEWTDADLGNFGSILPGCDIVANIIATEKADVPENRITPDQLHKAISGELGFWIHGRIEYDDVFGKSHWATFRYLLSQRDTLSPTMIPTQSGNDGD